DASIKYAKERRQFGHPIAEFESIQWKIAEMATRLDAARLLTYRAAVLRDEERPYSLEASMAKLEASRCADFCAKEAVQVHGGAVGRAHRVGVTGPPGAGKSTLISALAASWRAAGKKVGVVAVDPTSPFTGGALLGDRIRMARHSGDAGVFVRSLASRGALGG